MEELKTTVIELAGWACAILVPLIAMAPLLMVS
jgi:hypothetical protein